MTERQTISLLELAKKTGKAKEYHHDRARHGLAVWILGALLLLTLLSLWALMYSPADRIDYARDYFSFIKAAVPPLVTLVAGFYFGQSGR